MPDSIVITFDAQSFTDHLPSSCLTLLVELTPGQARNLQCTLNAALAAATEPAATEPAASEPATSDRTISLADAQLLLPPSHGPRVAKLWSAMVRSQAFETRCAECAPGQNYCNHYQAIDFPVADIVSHMKDFAATVNTGEVRNARTKTIDLGRALRAALMREQSEGRM